MSETVLVECDCLTSTAADMEYFEKGRRYMVDMKWAKKRGIWGYFKPLREVPEEEVAELQHEKKQRRAKTFAGTAD